MRILEIPLHNEGEGNGDVFSLGKRLLRGLESSLQLFKELFCGGRNGVVLCSSEARGLEEGYRNTDFDSQE